MNHANGAPSPSDSDYSNEVQSNGNSSHPQSAPGRSPLPDGSESQGGKKNGNYTYPTEGAMFFKILIPSIAAGAIIGKGGETIALLQQETQTRIKMSKATDFFPGTNERVCIVYGPTPESILQVYDFVAQKIREKPDSVVKSVVEFDTKQPADREKQVKILVPNSTAGMIIGKAGNYIKFIKEESGAYVQISQKAKDHAITERCITVIGDHTQTRNACGLILSKIFEDPLSNTCPNLSYADVVGPVPNYNPTGSPFANLVHGAAAHHPNEHMSYMNNPSHFFSNLRSTLRMSGYSEEVTTEIIAAMTTLSHYGILGLGLGLGGLAVNMGYMPASGHHVLNGNSGGSADSGFTHSNSSSMTGGLSSSSVGGSPGGYTDGVSSSPMSSSKSPLRYGSQQDSVDSSYNSQYDHSLLHHQQVPSSQHHQGQNDGWSASRHRWGAQRGGPPHQQQHQTYASNGLFGNESNNNMGVVAAGGDAMVPNGSAERSHITFDIAENLVGALLGREGKNISDIQAICGTQIQLAPKKKFPQGRRSVTITGTQNAVQATHSLIQQRLLQSEEKRGQLENVSPPSSAVSSPQQQLPLSPSSQFA